MGFGGSVLAMIQSLRDNARGRPSLKRGYPQLNERTAKPGFNIHYRKIKALSDADRAALRKRIALEKKLKTRKSLLALAISLIALAAMVWTTKKLYPDVLEWYEYRGQIKPVFPG